MSVNGTGVTLDSRTPIVGPGKSLTVTAATNMAGSASAILQIYDAATSSRLGYCSRGTSCSISIGQASAGSRRLVAALAKPSSTIPSTTAAARSDPLTVTWLDVRLSATSAYKVGASIYLDAVTNADLTNTPWSLVILDEQGRVVGTPCKSGASCSAVAAQPSGLPPRFRAAIGQLPRPPAQGIAGQILKQLSSPASIVDLQTQSDLVRPVRLMWGVDSCKSFTDDPNAGNGLYPQIVGILGTPDFWGRYLTDTICPGISAAEVHAAHNKRMGILPIYNDYNCSNVSGYDTGVQYAGAAVAAAQRLGIPRGRGLAIDIEPPGDACPGAANLDTGFLNGWYNGVTSAGYGAIYYGDGTSGSAFATQWCYTVQALPYIGKTSYLWSFQPSLLGGYMRSNAPAYSPNLTGCLGYVHAWQYQIGSSSWAAPDVDGDEATSELPVWYP